MMRGAKVLSLAVRNPQGEIILHTEQLDPRIYGGRLAKIPFLRGLTLLWDALGLGIKSLLFSAEVALEDEKEEGQENVFEGPVQWGTVALSLTFAVALFFVLPAFLAGRIELLLDIERAQFVSNLIEGAIRLTLLIGYIWIIGRLPDIRRLYGYHGAEHKTINAYEDGAELTPPIVANYSLQHPRCGTAFLLTVVVISIIFFSFLPPMSIPVRILSRIIFLPVVAGIAYEFIRFSARHQDNAFIRWITKPNLALQLLTTNEPDEDMLAVAIAAFKQVLIAESLEPIVPEPLTLVETPATD
ncbi:MAG TPA: DUF1385 domain-containing protein [candidate division Zixibacteria bacterium]|nr:DUF1385 domain-containing protein [candidate division Zixibacteria bacterium]